MARAGKKKCETTSSVIASRSRASSIILFFFSFSELHRGRRKIIDAWTKKRNDEEPIADVIGISRGKKSTVGIAEQWRTHRTHIFTLTVGNFSSATDKKKRVKNDFHGIE
jgi:hypothetical protein